MKKITQGIFTLLFCLTSLISEAQTTSIEAGIGIGNVLGAKHSLGKAELHLSLLQHFRFGALGLDLSTGGNFIPGTRSTEAPKLEILEPNDTKLSAAMILYRRSVFKKVYIEPRIGYTNLHAFVHSNEQKKVSQSNWSAGLGVGTELKKLNFSLRYQYYGQTANFLGTREHGMVQSESAPVAIVFLRLSYRLDLGQIF